MRHNFEDYLKIKNKLLTIGTLLSHLRHHILVSQAYCPNCNTFFATWAKNSFRVSARPIQCIRCKLKNPAKDFYDPLDDMVKAVEQGKKYKIPAVFDFSEHLRHKAFMLTK